MALLDEEEDEGERGRAEGGIQAIPRDRTCGEQWERCRSIHTYSVRPESVVRCGETRRVDGQESTGVASCS